MGALFCWLPAPGVQGLLKLETSRSSSTGAVAVNAMVVMDAGAPLFTT